MQTACYNEEEYPFAIYPDSISVVCNPIAIDSDYAPTTITATLIRKNNISVIPTAGQKVLLSIKDTNGRYRGFQSYYTLYSNASGQASAIYTGDTSYIGKLYIEAAVISISNNNISDTIKGEGILFETTTKPN